jgi:UDP-N-acetylglucosamine 2-epimerase (non-hydrolysing)/GDP/UDP-N,N'-diacetylbacillosamine 2-epimerase (hydrolysing)
MQLGSPLLLATYHPVTLENDSASAMRRLLAALDAFPDANIVLTYSNADAEGRKLNQLVEQYAATKRGRVRAFASLGQQRYLSLMRVCDVVIGNSSSGLTEAPALKKATVNVGDRQRGRLKATSVLDCPEETAAIVSAIRTVLSEDFRARLPATRSLYGEGDASVAIADVLKRVPLGGLLRKQFHTV